MKKIFANIKRRFLLRFYRSSLKEVMLRQMSGEEGLELAQRFFKYKTHQLSKNK